MAYSADGREQAGMGIDSADYDNDGWPDIVKTNFSDDANNLYHNDHNGQFTDMAGATGFGSVSIPFLAFGVKFLDFDNDGWKDIFVANGHVNPQVDKHSFGVTYAERLLLFHNLRRQKFDEIGMDAGSAMSRRYVARGAATADFLNSGAEDVLITVLDGSPILLRNQTQKRGHWLRIKVVGTRSNRDGFGARVELKAGGITQNAEVRANSSFESASDPRLHFGLGAATRVESIMVHWPSGKVDRLEGETADQELVIEVLRIPRLGWRQRSGAGSARELLRVLLVRGVEEVDAGSEARASGSGHGVDPVAHVLDGGLIELLEAAALRVAEKSSGRDASRSAVLAIGDGDAEDLVAVGAHHGVHLQIECADSLRHRNFE